jgi:DnaJ-class molecular chaperone
VSVRCQTCNGTGRGVFGGNCATCQGAGQTSEWQAALMTIVVLAIVIGIALALLLH